MQRKLKSNLKKLVSFLLCVMLIVATFPIHCLNGTVFAEGETQYAYNCMSFKRSLNAVNANNGGTHEIILTDDIIISQDDEIQPMNNSETFMFLLTNPDEGNASERKNVTIKSDGKRTYKIQSLKPNIGLLNIIGGAGLTLNLENVVIDGGSTELGREFDFIKLQGTYNYSDESYSLEVNFKEGATIQNVNRDRNSGNHMINVDASKFNFCGGSIKNCCAFEGGAIYLSGGLLELMYGEISNCTAIRGGAIFSNGGQIKDSSKENSGFKIDSCIASEVGGALYTSWVDAYFNGLQIKNCKAGNAGGAIYERDLGVTQIDDITIEKCSVNRVNENLLEDELLSYGGGAIANGAGRNLLIMGGNISDCSTNMNGGAILNYPEGKLAVYGGKIKNCSITKNDHKVSPEDLDKSFKKFLGNAICNNCSGGMLIVKPGKKLEIEVSNQAQGNDMLSSVSGYKGLFDRTYFETGQMSPDPDSINYNLYDESWGILLTGGAPALQLECVILAPRKDGTGKIIEEEKKFTPAEVAKYQYNPNSPESKDEAEYFGPTNRKVTFRYKWTSSGGNIKPEEVGVSIDGGKNFFYLHKDKGKPEGEIITGVNPEDLSNDGLVYQSYYAFSVGDTKPASGKAPTSNALHGKFDVVLKLGLAGGTGLSQPFKLWTDMTPPEAPVITEIDGSELEKGEKSPPIQYYKFKNTDTTKYFTHDPITFKGTGCQGCTLEMYKSDDIKKAEGGIIRIKKTAKPIISEKIGDDNFTGPADMETPWEIVLNDVSKHLPESKEAELILIQKDQAGNISEMSSVKVGVDMHGPEGKMKFDGLSYWFGNFLTNLTFGLFSPEKFDVKVKAYDFGSDVKNVEWLKSNEAFESSEALEKRFPSNSTSWEAAQKDSENSVSKPINDKLQKVKESTWTFSIQKTQNEKFFVYAKLTDVNGNVTYRRSDGAVFYTPVSAQDLTYVKKSKANPSSEIPLNGNREIFEKTFDGKKLTEENFKSEIKENLFKFSLKAAYLDGLKAEKHNISFKYYPFDLKAEDISENHYPFPSFNIKVDIKKSTLSDATIKINGYQDQYTYGDKPFKVYVEGLPEDLKAKLEIEDVEGSNVAQIDDDGSVTLKGCGKFKIKASTTEDENYNAFSTETEVITVLPCPLKIKGLTPNDREYDATNILKIFQNENTGLTLINEENDASSANLSLNVSGTEWIAKFADASVGNDKEAKFEENYFKEHFRLVGDDAANFRLEMPTFKANITPKKVKFDPQSVKINSKDYDGTDKAEFEELPKFLDDFIYNELKIEDLPIRFEDAMPGQNKLVFIDRENFDLSLVNNSYSKDNYDFSELLDNPIGTANIYVTAVTIENFPRYINQNTLEIHGTGIRGYEIQIIDSEGNALSTEEENQIIVDEDGNWQATLINLHKRDNSINVIQKDPNLDIQSEPVSKSVFVDIDLPSGQVKINDVNVVTKILSGSDMGDQKIFEMFYPYGVGVKIFAQDAFSGVDYIKYFVSDQFYSTADQIEAPNIEWKDGANIEDYQVPEASAEFNINKENESKKFFIYTQIKDKAGNITYLRTFGAVLYDELDVSGDLSYTRCSDQPVAVKINCHGSEIQSIRLKSKDGRLDQILESGSQWEVKDSENGQLLSLNLGDMNSFLEAGDYEIEVIYKPGCLLDESDQNINLENLPSKKVNLTVRDLELSDQDFFGDLASKDERVYGEEVNLSNNQDITYTVESLGGNAEIRNRAETGAPYAKMTKVGKVKIVASYRGIYTRTREITIKPKAVTINNIYARDKEYDKTTNASYYLKLDDREIDSFSEAYSYLEAKFDNMSEDEKASYGSKYSYINKNISKNLRIEGLLPEDIGKVYVNGNRVLAQFENCSAGPDKKVNFSGFELCDVPGYNISGNYIFIQPTKKATITQKSIRIVDIQISDKTADGGVDADFAKDPVITGIVEGDQVRIEGNPVFEHSGPGNSIPVHCGSVVLVGEDASNYVLVWPSITANIYPVSANNDSGNAGGGGGDDSIIKPTAGENDFDSDFVNKYDDLSHDKSLGDDAIAENVMTCLVVFLTVSLLSTLTIILIRNKNKQK